MNRKAKALQSFFPIRVMPSRIYWDLTKEDMKRPEVNGKPVNMHKWVMGIRKRRQSGYVNALVLLPKPTMQRKRKRAIAKARFKTKLHDMRY